MPPTSLPKDDFIGLVRKSGLIDDDRLEAFLASLQNRLPSEPKELAALFVKEQMLTDYQAGLLLKGRYKGFIIGGKYRLLDQLGVGGMGVVFLGEHMRMKRLVAMKMLPEQQMAIPGAVERFEREARAVAALNHPNIVGAHDIDVDGKTHYIAMEFIDGVDLQSLVKHRGPLDPLRAAHYIAQAANGLQHAHVAAGLVHRDIKPSNLLLDRGGTIKILDMGLARFYGDRTDTITARFDENTVLGTADFISPEQALESSKVDIRADIYSLGATFYYLLTGRPPFLEGTVTQKLLFHQLREPTPVTQFRTDVPPAMLAVLDMMMKKSRDERFQEPIEVAIALTPWTNIPIPPPTDGEIPKRTLGVGSSRIEPAPPSTTPAPASAKLSTQFTPPKQQQSATWVRSTGANAIASPMYATPTPQSGLTAPNLNDPSAMSGFIPTLIPAPTLAGPVPGMAKPKSTPWLYIALGVCVLAIGGVIVVFFQTGRKNTVDVKENPKLQTRPPKELIVDNSGATGRYPNIQTAIGDSIPGDTIVLAEPIWHENIQITQVQSKGGGLTIIGRTPDAGPVSWFPQKGFEGKPLVEIDNVSGITLKNLQLYGRIDDRRSDSPITCPELVRISSLCPQTTLEDIRLQDFSRAGIICDGASGVNKPIVFKNIKVKIPKSQTTGILLRGESAKITQDVEISNSLFYSEGEPSEAQYAIEFLGPNARIKITNNRVSRITAFVRFSLQGNMSSTLHFDCRNNTCYQVRTLIDLAGIPTRNQTYGKARLERNLLTASDTWIRMDSQALPPDLDFLEPGENGSEKANLPGTNLVGAVTLPDALSELIIQNLPPTSDRYLTYGANSSLASAASGNRAIGYERSR